MCFSTAAAAAADAVGREARVDINPIKLFQLGVRRCCRRSEPEQRQSTMRDTNDTADSHSASVALVSMRAHQRMNVLPINADGQAIDLRYPQPAVSMAHTCQPERNGNGPFNTYKL